MKLLIILSLLSTLSFADEHHKDLKSLTNCKSCHGIVHKGKTSFEIKKFDYEDNITAKTGAIFSGQKISESYLNIKNKKTLSRPWDIHAARGLRCIDCHLEADIKPDKHDHKLSHLKMDPRHFKVSDYSFDQKKGFIEHPKCKKCHDPMIPHGDVPFAKRHIQKLTCTACHIPHVYGPAARRVVNDKIVEYQGVDPDNQRSLNSMFNRGFRPKLFPKKSKQKLGPYNEVHYVQDNKDWVKKHTVGHGVSRLEFVEFDCASCHSRGGIIGSTKGADFYIFGNGEIWWIELIGKIIMWLSFLGIFFHIGLRLIVRRKKDQSHNLVVVQLYPLLERGWHWIMAASVIVLIITGIIIHNGGSVFGIASLIHNLIAMVLIINTIYGFSYLIFSGEIKQYIPSIKTFLGDMIAQIKYYLLLPNAKGARITRDRKFNPLQQITYLKIVFGLLPFQILTGILIFFPIDLLGGLSIVGPIHFAGSMLFFVFLFVHVYMTTTGHTPLAHIKAMITGRDQIEGDHDER